MADIKEVKKLLDEINAAVASYDPSLKEQARDILLKQAFGTEAKTFSSAHGTKNSGGGSETEQTQFHQLVEKWTPSTQAEWALLGAYFFQVTLKNASVNAFDQKPALIRQIGKAGKAKQAKKKYVVTTNGINFVEEKLNAQQS